MKIIRILTALLIIPVILTACKGAPDTGTPSSQRQTSREISATDASNPDDGGSAAREEVSTANAENSGLQIDEESTPSQDGGSSSEDAEKIRLAPGNETAYSVSELSFMRDGRKIWGELYMPDAEGSFAMVVLVHGFGVDHSNLEPYAQLFASQGFAVYNFDFPGGCPVNNSDGNMLDMSVLTEAADLNVIIDGILELPYLDNDNLILLGESQGGLVSTYVAAHRPEDIRSLIILYPAFSLRDRIAGMVSDPETIPETMVMFDETIGSIYARDILSFDIYEMIPDYPGPVLMIHGTEDEKVPFEYSERAEEAFPDAQLIRIDGAGHGFSGEHYEFALKSSLEFAINVYN